MAIILRSFPNRDVGFVDWLDAAARGAMDEAPALGEAVPSVWASDLVLMLP